MEITVSSLFKTLENQVSVTFSSLYGSCDGLWEGTPPKVNAKYEVEISIDDQLTWSANAFETNERNYILEGSNDHLKIAAKVETIEDDDSCVLRLGNSILMVEIKNVPQLQKGTFIEIRPKKLKIFDSNL